MTESVFGYREQRARKSHQCYWCGDDIEIGKFYPKWKYKSDNQIEEILVHKECEAAWQKATDENGGHYEADMHEHARGCTCQRGHCECPEKVES